MKLFTNKKQLQTEIRKFNNISFVPTMGALHRGHESIIKKSVKRSGKTLVSIFVNQSFKPMFILIFFNFNTITGIF